MLYYNGGDIWFEHLDGLYERDDLVIAKLTADLPQLTRPSMTSFVCFVFMETTVNDLILSAVKQAVLRSNKPFSKIAFCGLNKEYRKKFKNEFEDHGFGLGFFEGLEEAKTFLLP